VGVAASIYFRAVRIDGIELQDMQFVASLSDARYPSSGPREASASLVVFTDYRCPACRRAHPAMLAAAEETGARIVYRDLPIFGQESEDAARVALATQAQGLYPQVHDAFMRESRPLSSARMRAIVESLGGDWGAVLAAIEAGGPSQILTANRRDAMHLAVAGTPTYVIGRYRYIGAMSETQFQRAIERSD